MIKLIMIMQFMIYDNVDNDMNNYVVLTILIMIFMINHE